MMIVAIVLALFGLGFWLSRRITLLTTAAALLCLSGISYSTLNEAGLDRDLNGTVDLVAWVGGLALAGVILAVISIKLPRKP